MTKKHKAKVFLDVQGRKEPFYIKHCSLENNVNSSYSTVKMKMSPVVDRSTETNIRYFPIYPTDNLNVFLCSVCGVYRQKSTIKAHMTKKHKARVCLEIPKESAEFWESRKSYLDEKIHGHSKAVGEEDSFHSVQMLPLKEENLIDDSEEINPCFKIEIKEEIKNDDHMLNLAATDDLFSNISYY